jgi:hypothetical protein
MADEPIYYKDLIAPNNSIENCITQLQELKKTYDAMYQSVTSEAAGIQKSLQMVSGATEKGRKEITSASKEADKLAQAQRALAQAESETAQEIARLKELTREQNAMNKANAKQAMAAADSYDYLSAQYTKNKLILNKMSEEERANTKAGKELEEETKRIYERMNELQKSTGKYTLQVGNYTIAADSMRQAIKQGEIALTEMRQAGQDNTATFQQLADKVAKMKDAMNDTKQMINAMASDTSNLDAILQGMAVGTGGFAAVTGAMQLFGGESKEVEEAQRKLQAAIALVNGVTAIQNALQKQSALVTKLKALQTAILSKFQKENTATTVANTTAIKAQGVATETTTKATKGLGKALNALKSNPVILALSALVALGVGVVAVVKKVRAAQKEAYEDELKQLEATEAKRKVAMQVHETAISNYQQEIKLAQAEGKSQQEILDLRAKELQERSDMAIRSTAWNKKEIDALDANRQKLLQNQATLKAADAEQIKLKKYKREEIEAENALLERQIEIAEQQIEVNKELEVEFIAMAEERRQLAIDTAKAEEDSLRALEDARINLIKGQFKRERAATTANYDRQIADLKTRLENEKNLTTKQVENINALIVELEKTKNVELDKINAQERATNLAAQRETEQLRLSIMESGMEKERAVLDANYKKETDDLRTKLQTDKDLTATQRAEMNKQLLLLQEIYLQDVAKLNQQARENELNAELKSIELRRAAMVGGERLSVADSMRELEIKRELELAANKKLAVELRQDEAAINAKWDAEKLKTQDQIAREVAEHQLNIQQELAKSEIDIAQMSEKKKNAEKLKLEKQALEQRLKLNAEANIKMSDAEVKTIENQIKKLDADIKKEGAPQDLYDLLGLNVTDDQKEALNESFEYAKQALTQFYDYKLQLAQRSVEQANLEVEAAQNTLNSEREARAAGYANNVAMAEKELAAAKQNQRKALKQEQDAQKAQQKIATVEQAVNMVTASSKILSQFGMPWAIPVLALMWGTFIGSKIKAKQLSSEQYGDGTVELLEGGSHQSGNDIDLGTKKDGTRRRAEGGEFFAVINRRSSRKYRKEIPQLINALNNDTFADKYMHAYDATNAQIIPIFEGTAQLNSIAKDMREINERGRQTVIYTADGWIEKRGNVTRIIKK